jgi:hypothetical protein
MLKNLVNIKNIVDYIDSISDIDKINLSPIVDDEIKINDLKLESKKIQKLSFNNIFGKNFIIENDIKVISNIFIIHVGKIFIKETQNTKFTIKMENNKENEFKTNESSLKKIYNLINELEIKHLKLNNINAETVNFGDLEDNKILHIIKPNLSKSIINIELNPEIVYIIEDYNGTINFDMKKCLEISKCKECPKTECPKCEECTECEKCAKCPESLYSYFFGVREDFTTDKKINIVNLIFFIILIYIIMKFLFNRNSSNMIS